MLSLPLDHSTAHCYICVVTSVIAMFLHIERGSSTPISRQIAEQIAALCAGESLKVGDRLPSVRQLAQQLAVNQNTVLRVYERLTAEGLFEMRHGEGTFVAGERFAAANGKAAAAVRR